MNKSEKTEIPQEEKGSREVQITLPQSSIFCERSSFEQALRVAQMLSKSDMIPTSYRGNVQNVMVALEISNRLRISPLMVMQNLYVIQGKPSWSSSFIIGVMNTSKRFSPLEFEMRGEGNSDAYGCVARAVELSTGKELKSSKVTLGMAKSEGWYSKAGSKWKSMPDQILKYRAEAFFGRIHAPEILMGMHTAEETNNIVTRAHIENLLASSKEEAPTWLEKNRFEYYVQMQFGMMCAGKRKAPFVSYDPGMVQESLCLAIIECPADESLQEQLKERLEKATEIITREMYVLKKLPQER